MKYKVLLVDDETIILEGFRRLFDWEAHSCEIVGQAMDGIAAVSQVEALHPDIVIMDINIPMLNGIEAFRRMKAENPILRCIVVSGYDDFQYCQEALRLSVDDYILKPVDYQKFGDVLDRTIANLNEDRVIRFVHNESQDKETSIVSNIVQWINNHYSEDISLQCLSSEFHLSSAYISQLFKNKIGTNYFTYLSKIRLNKAKQLLLTSDLSISEIAEMVGYKDYRSFTRAYKSVMGKQPSSERILSKVTS